MILKIDNNDNKYLTCYEKPLVTALCYLKKDYIMMFSSSWNFSYTSQNKEIKQNYEMWNLLKSLEKNLNVSVKICDHLEPASIVKHINELTPVISYVDTYYCQWLPTYQKQHSHHYVLIVGYSKDSFLCFDKYSKEMLEISFTEYEKACGECVLIENKNNYDFFKEKEIFKTFISDLLLYNNEEYNMFKNMHNFSSYILNDFNLYEAVKDYKDVRSATIFIWLNSICTGRKKYSLFLKNIKEKIKEIEIDKCISGLDDIYNRWYEIIITMLTASYRNKNLDDKRKENIARKIEDIAKIEFEIYSELINRFNEYWDN